MSLIKKHQYFSFCKLLCSIHPYSILNPKKKLNNIYTYAFLRIFLTFKSKIKTSKIAAYANIQSTNQLCYELIIIWAIKLTELLKCLPMRA